MTYCVEAQGLSKKFCHSLSWNMRYAFQDTLSYFVNRKIATSVIRPHEFWALKDVSFSLKPGETMAIIGRNGSGKSTLLRLLLGVYEPDEGSVRIQGNVIAFMNVGTTFHQEYTGRENIMLSASTFGMKPAEIRSRMPSIIEFSELGDFLDDPIKYYSRGMITKLGLAIAFHCRGDVILADEALSGGDAAFVEKCKAKIKELKNSGATIVLSSHNLKLLESICQKVLWLEKGTVRTFGPAETILPEYSLPAKS